MGTLIMVSAFINQGKVNTFLSTRTISTNLMQITCSYQE